MASKSGFEVLVELRCKRIDRSTRLNPARLRFLSETVPQRHQAQAFHTAVSLARVGTHDVDVRLISHLAALSEPHAEVNAGMHRTEDAGFVATERRPLAMFLE